MRTLPSATVVAAGTLIVFAIATSALGRVATTEPQQPSPHLAATPIAADTTPRFSVAANLVELDSCDPAVLARLTPAPVGIEEMAARNSALSAMEAYNAIVTAYSEADGAHSVESLLALVPP